MRVLKKVEGSVLWLIRSNGWAEHNLARETEKRGVDPSRVVFADKLPHAQHLARQRHADLAVDAFNYNGHTTSSDALWAGVPVVTMAGKQFAARVAASLLTALDLPELITQNEEEYEGLITRLATTPELLLGIRAKLAERRLNSPLFNAGFYTRTFESGLERAYELYRAGMQAQDIRVADP
jgi:predicted O-linked N-acetylglucosamine transferase (SPINDLY family)